jgi:DNA modification methylase
VERLMDGQKADMVFTDPPYGVDYEGKTKDALKINNDKNTDTFSQSIPLWPLRGGASAYVCCPAGNNFMDFALPFAENLYQSSTIIWAKNSLVMGHGDYHYQHEPILYGWEKSAPHKFYGDRSQTTLWFIDRPSRSKEHPTMKPIELMVKALKNSSQDEEIVFDPFGGSGPPSSPVSN